jgi:NADH:ubiquinone oxidoreductase subunit 4 (subunit M)
LDFNEAHKTNIMMKVAHLQNMAIQGPIFFFHSWIPNWYETSKTNVSVKALYVG